VGMEVSRVVVGWELLVVGAVSSLT
jgi:hypothetical protein